MRITDLIAGNGFIIINRYIANEYGLHEAIMLGELSYEYNYWESKNELEDGWFYSSVENVKSATTLSAYQQRSALKNLEEKGLVEVKQKGMPAKRYVFLNLEEMRIQFSNETIFRSEKTEEQEVKKLNNLCQKTEEHEVKKLSGNNNLYNNNILPNINNYSVTYTTNQKYKSICAQKEKPDSEPSKKKKKKDFVPPTIEEVKAYCEQRNNGIDPESFIAYYETRGWMAGKVKMVSWKAAVITWEKKERERNRNGEYQRSNGKYADESDREYDAYLRSLCEDC